MSTWSACWRPFNDQPVPSGPDCKGRVFGYRCGTTIIRDKLRIVLEDGSYIDFWWSAKIPGRFAHHWERVHVDGTIYRHDNMPHPRWKGVSTFPQHYHQEKPNVVVESDLPSDPPEAALRAFLTFARQTLNLTKKTE